MKKKNIFGKFMAILQNILVLLNIVLIILLEILPTKYLLISLGVLLAIDLFITFFLLKKKKSKAKKKSRRTKSYIASFILIVLLSFGTYYELSTLGFLNKFNGKTYSSKKYNVVVLKDSKYETMKDLEYSSIGILKDNDDLQKDALSKLKKYSLKNIEYEDYGTMFNSLINSEVSSILIDEASLEVIYENNEEYSSLIKIIYSIETKKEIESKKVDIDVINEPFNVYISGVDTFGNVSATSRSDVNLVVSVNPKTHQLLITSIPRDYYVTLRGKKSKDKLTHAGIYGVETSMGTLEDLLDTKIDYYLKVNFTSVINIVDVLGGIDVKSNYSFTSKDGYKYVKGNNHLNGEKTLSFVRERHAFSGGDRVRGENQQIVLQAIINKALTPSVLIKYNSLLKSVDGYFTTNISDDVIKKLINKQLDDNSSWNIETYNLDGRDGSDYTYSFKSQKLYVMIPDEETVSTAKEKIKAIME